MVDLEDGIGAREMIFVLFTREKRDAHPFDSRWLVTSPRQLGW